MKSGKYEKAKSTSQLCCMDGYGSSKSKRVYLCNATSMDFKAAFDGWLISLQTRGTDSGSDGLVLSCLLPPSSIVILTSLDSVTASRIGQICFSFISFFQCCPI